MACPNMTCPLPTRSKAEAVREPGLCQFLAGVPVAGLDEGNSAFEVQGTQRGYRRTHEKVGIGAGQRRTLKAYLRQPVGPAHDVDDARDRPSRRHWVEAVPEDTPTGQSWTEVHRGQRFHLGGQVDSDDTAVPDSSPHDLDRHVVQRPAVDQQVAVGEDRREEAGKGEAGTHRRPQWPRS